MHSLRYAAETAALRQNYTEKSIVIKKVLTIATAMLAVCAGIASCKKRDAEPVLQLQVATEPAAVSAKPSTGIAWFPGDVDAAFEHAKAEGKPVFLYWSAEWCPPCHELKATLFMRPEFQGKLKLFIPVYLDGDAPGAQNWGDAFGVTAYPTIVILKSDRTELTRIVGGMDVARYNDVLDMALGDVQPVRQLLASLDQNTEPLSMGDCRRLAYNGWLLDDAITNAPAKTTEDLRRAIEGCPVDARTERARLMMAAAFASATTDAEALKAGKPPSATTVMLVKNVSDLLADAPLALSVADTFLWLSDGFFLAAKADPKTAVELLTRWNGVMSAIVNNSRTSDSDRCYAVANQLRATKALSADGKIPSELASMARQNVDSALSRKHSEDARSSVVNGSILVLYFLGDMDRLFTVLNQEMATTKTPYYYMGGLAEIEEQRGNKDKAIGWLERSYRESKGVATRFEWGTDYVVGLVRMRPNDAAGIRLAALTVLDELDGPDRIHSRTASRLKRLDSTLREWNKAGAYKGDIAALRKRMDDICGKIPEANVARQKCDEFLANA